MAEYYETLSDVKRHADKIRSCATETDLFIALCYPLKIKLLTEIAKRLSKIEKLLEKQIEICKKKKVRKRRKLTSKQKQKIMKGLEKYWKKRLGVE